ncbi:hypothetical protein L2735_11395 [Shewanella olleyana]|uniref:hypothetical protein n=1 Tax=Shewanella olleyana TaxID=135626 RepID=UPI00200FCA6F|nr:hypothetical protein [Shewanella olleyana]MCL1067408.1 hypothetical protein [Shewanella olleyana]
MMIKKGFILLASSVLLSSVPHAAMAETENNTGQDATQPLTRFDLRAEYNSGGNNSSNNITTLRADAPISLDDNGIAYFRIDVPFVNVPDENSFSQAGVYTQAIWIAPKELSFAKKYDWGAGISANIGGGTLGREKTTWIPTFGTSIPISPFGAEHKGSAFIPLFRYWRGEEEFDSAGQLTFDSVNELRLLPTVNFNLPWKYFEVLTLWGNADWKVNFDDGVKNPNKQSGDYYIPYDITIGKMIANRKVIVSMTFTGPLISSGEYKQEQYDHTALFRIGFFFG